MKHTPIIILLIIFQISCKETNREVETATKSTEIIESNNFESDLNNKPKLFLKFWSGMSKREYEKVTNILIEENVLDGEYPIAKYHIGNCEYLMLEATFESEGLTEIKLPLNYCLYPIYREKYNLPELVKRTFPREPFEPEGEWVEEFVLEKIPTIIEKAGNLIFFDYQLHKEFRKRKPEQEDYPGFGGSFGEMIVYYKSKKHYLKEQQIKREKIKAHKEKMDSINKTEKQALEEI